jgi:hypothetical protein
MKKLWDCSVFVSNSELPLGADSPPRQAVIGAMESMGLDVTSCSSGWGGEESQPKIAKLKAKIAELEKENAKLQKYPKEQG